MYADPQGKESCFWIWCFQGKNLHTFVKIVPVNGNETVPPYLVRETFGNMSVRTAFWTILNAFTPSLVHCFLHWFFQQLFSKTTFPIYIFVTDRLQLLKWMCAWIRWFKLILTMYCTRTAFGKFLYPRLHVSPSKLHYRHSSWEGFNLGY